MSQPRITIYTTATCPFCIRAKDLLTRKGADFDEIDVGEILEDIQSGEDPSEALGDLLEDAENLAESFGDDGSGTIEIHGETIDFTSEICFAGFGDFTIGGSYAENDNGVAGGFGDESGWALGITYDAPGPWAFGIETYQGEFDNGAGFVDDEYQAYQLAASRDVGPGVDWDITYTRVETSNIFGNIDGDVLATSLNLSF